MISSDCSCKRIVAGTYDVLINEPLVASQKSVLTDYLEHFERYETELGHHHNYHRQQQLQIQLLQEAPANGAASDQPATAAAAQPPPTCGYIDEFRLLKELSKSLKENKANLVEGETEQNQRKNRYKDIIPFSHTRVILSCNPDGPHNLANGSHHHHQQPNIASSQEHASGCHSANGFDCVSQSYINANYIRGPSGSPRAYIACQGPLPCTLNDFWRMIWECNVSVIVMACNEHESGKPKCELYWPDQIDASQTYGNFRVTLLRVRQINSDFLIRKFSVKLLGPAPAATGKPLVVNQRPMDGQSSGSSLSGASNSSGGGSPSMSSKSDNNLTSHETTTMRPGDEENELEMAGGRPVLMERTICQFHYTTWPDHGVPDSVHPILELVRLIREVQPDEDKPILVHCSAGCGRTGTICCIDYVWGLVRMGKLDESFNLCNIISEMRQQRMAMVQTLEQYILCHRAVAALFMQQLQLISLDNNHNHHLEKCNNLNDTSSSNNNTSSSIDDSAIEDNELEDEGREEEGDDYEYEQELGPVFI